MVFLLGKRSLDPSLNRPRTSFALVRPLVESEVLPFLNVIGSLTIGLYARQHDKAGTSYAESVLTPLNATQW